MWNAHFLEVQTCLDNFNQVREYFVFFSIPYTSPKENTHFAYHSFRFIYREMCAFFLFDCSQWKVVWDLFARGDKQSQCPLGGLRKLEKFDVSSSSLKGNYYAYYLQQCREREKDFCLSYAKEKFRLKLDPSEISSEYKHWIFPTTNLPVLPTSVP
jgi:hypothetical protein